MKIAAHRGTRLHAPENSRLAFLSAYVAGADVLELDLQLTKDGHLVLSHDGTTDRVTGQPGRIIDLTLAELGEMDWSETFKPRDSPNFTFFTDPKRKLAPLTFPVLLDWLPDDVELLVELKHDSSEQTGRRDEFVQKAVAALQSFGVEHRTVLYSKDPDVLKQVRVLAPGLRLAAFDYAKTPDEQLALLKTTKADGLVTQIENVVDAAGVLTAFGKKLEAYCKTQKLAVGAVLYPGRKPGIFTETEYRVLSKLPFVWSISTDSVPDVQHLWRRGVRIVDTPFAGETVNREQFALGYAKANGFGLVYQKDGIHLDIASYPAFPTPPTDPLDIRLSAIENKLTYTVKDWPYYSGGGVGVVNGIRGDFSAETTYTVERVGQATTLEMAVLNVDPGAHVGKRPTSFRDKDSFYDPHGAPPYVGVEHDEDDGFRINWNLGSEYDNNQYGRPVGDGATPRGARLRLDRRGPFFAAYYRNAIDNQGNAIGPHDWVCVGVTRNDSLNPVVYLRCVAKRWRQEDPANPSEFMPILPNRFTFTQLTVNRFISSNQ